MNSRISLALTGAHVVLPDAGNVLFFRPPAGFDFGGLDAARVVAVQGFAPDHAGLLARGLKVSAVAEAGDYAAAVVTMAKAKAETLDMIAQAIAFLPEGATILVDGAKGDGADSVLKMCRQMADVGPAYSKAHGKVFTFPNPAKAPDGWRAGTSEVDGFVTRPGVFSADGIDPGSALLAANLPPLKGAVCDLGAGWGYLAATVLAANEGVTTLDLVEAEHGALECARQNVSDPRAAFHWADALGWSGRYDCVISNPPFHIGRETTTALGQDFIRKAARILTPRGSFVMVANRHLPYENVLRECFTEVVVLAETGAYKVVSARRPVKG